MINAALKVTSHVGRDLLQSAQLFRHEHTVIWEYVSNGLQYKDVGIKPTVVVKIDSKAKKIQIRDNGRGMLIEDLKQYFQMHGENLDRKRGRPGRGYFGTGKSAAFGIARTLCITTVRDKKLSKVQLTREDIDNCADGTAIPVKILEHEVKTTSQNGTLIEIEDIFLRQIDVGSIIRHVERHVAHWPEATVIINNHECEYIEPEINREIRIATKGTDYEKTLGDTSLVIKVAKSPLEEERRGIAILSEGVWHETSLAGCERKAFAEYLFGSLEVPALALDRSETPAFDMSRSMKLNARNETVAQIMRFIGVNLENVRRELERQDRDRRQTEEQKRLQQQGSKIAELINNHFKEWSTKLRSTMSKAGTGRDLLSAKDKDNAAETDAIFGDKITGLVVGLDSYHGKKSTTSDPNPDPEPNPEPNIQLPKVKLDDKSSEKVAKPASETKRKISSGGFNVAFEKIGVNEKRAKYDKETRTIYVNLEHPRIAVELKKATGLSPIDDPNFVRMAYEIAFTEYAIVLAQELSSVEYYYDPQDALVDVRQTLDDLSKAFAGVWNQTGMT